MLNNLMKNIVIVTLRKITALCFMLPFELQANSNEDITIQSFDLRVVPIAHSSLSLG